MPAQSRLNSAPLFVIHLKASIFFGFVNNVKLMVNFVHGKISIVNFIMLKGGGKMKKLFVVCLVICCSLIVFIPNTLGDVRPDENKTVVLEGFDDLAAEDIGRTDGAVGSFDIHYELGYGDGKMQLVQTDVSRQGLALIPDYASGYNEGILRTTYYRLGSKNASAERAEALSEAWSTADGFRFYLKNNTDDNIYLSIPVFFTDPSAPSDDNTVCFSLYTGTKLYDMEGNLVETEFVSEGWNNHQVIIPWDFEGWVDIPMTLGGVGGNDRDGEYGWDLIQWEDESKLNNSYISFANVYYVQFDFRLSTPGYIMELEEPESYNIVIDSIQLYQEQAGDISYLPGDLTPELPPIESQSTKEATASQTALTENTNTAAQYTHNSLATKAVGEMDNTALWIIAGVCVVLVIIAVTAVLWIKKKKINKQ